MTKPAIQFLTIFTYHIFGTEVERHPAAAIHNAMALDLVPTKGIEWSINHMPMALVGAVEVARFLQTTLTHYIPKPYYYNHYGKASNSNDLIVSQFVQRETELVSEWLQSKSLHFKLSNEALNEFDKLCVDYFGISLTGNDTMLHIE